MQHINKLTQRLLSFIFVLCFILTCGCSKNSGADESFLPESSETVFHENSANESTSNENSANESAENEHSFDWSNVPPDTRDDKIAECVVMTTEKTAYSIDEKMTVIISTNHKNEHVIYYGECFYFEYFKDGEWHKCQKTFYYREPAHRFGYDEIYEVTFIIDISERIDEGYEKYRVVNSFDSEEHKPGLIYSNEFTLLP